MAWPPICHLPCRNRAPPNLHGVFLATTFADIIRVSGAPGRIRTSDPRFVVCCSSPLVRHLASHCRCGRCSWSAHPGPFMREQTVGLTASKARCRTPITRHAKPTRRSRPWDRWYAETAAIDRAGPARERKCGNVPAAGDLVRDHQRSNEVASCAAEAAEIRKRADGTTPAEAAPRPPPPSAARL